MRSFDFSPLSFDVNSHFGAYSDGPKSAKLGRLFLTNQKRSNFIKSAYNKTPPCCRWNHRSFQSQSNNKYWRWLDCLTQQKGTEPARRLTRNTFIKMLMRDSFCIMYCSGPYQSGGPSHFDPFLSHLIHSGN